MRKAARQKRNKKQHKKRSYKKYVWILLIAAIALGVYKFTRPGRWSGGNRLVLATAKNSGETIITVIDADRGITNIYVDQNTQVNAARQMGSWKMGSIWKLGEQEGEPGEFFSDTIIKTFSIPIDAWATEGVIPLIDGNLFSGTKALFLHTKTNLTFRDKLKIFGEAISTPSKDQEKIVLSETPYLRKEKLADGSEGFIPQGSLPSSLSNLFTHPTFMDPKLKIGIIETVGDRQLLANLANIIEVLGNKVISVEESQESLSECLVKSTHKEAAQELGKVLNCKISNEAPTGNIDLQIYTGKDLLRNL